MKRETETKMKPRDTNLRVDTLANKNKNAKETELWCKMAHKTMMMAMKQQRKIWNSQ